MGYERTLLTRWTRRDWLAIAVIALTTMFLVGTSIMLLATSAQIEGEVDSVDALESAAFARGDGDASGTVALPVATATTANGTNATVVGVPNRSVRFVSSFDNATLAAPPPDGVARQGTGPNTTVRLTGRSDTVTRDVRSAPNRSVLPTRWYVTDESTVRRLGRTGTYEITLDSAANGTGVASDPSDRGTLLLGTPVFLISGASELLQLLGLVTLGSGILIGVTVYSVTRMTVRDRRRALFVIRSTGGTRSRLVGLFSARAALLTGAGSAFGYALGVIAISAVLNVATYFGELTTLDLSGSPTDWLVIGAMLVILLLVGAVAGALSAVRTAFAPPGSLMDAGSAAVEDAGSVGSRLRGALGVQLLGLRTVVPMTAALMVLVALAVISVSIGVTLAPVAGATDGVVMSPDASYPLQSEVDEDIASSFRSEGIPASPEVLLPQVGDGQSYLLRGVNYSAYGQVSDVRIVEGDPPTQRDHALVGTGLARTLGVSVGDRVTVGGGTAFGVDRVTVVGRFDGQGYVDDQLLISLPAAKDLANMDAGTVQIVRTTGVEEPPPSDGEESDPVAPADIVITEVDAPQVALTNTTVPVEVTLENRGNGSGTIDLSVPNNGTALVRSVDVDGGQNRTVTLEASFDEPGEYTLSFGDIQSQIRVSESRSDVAVTDVSVPETGLVNRSVPIDVTLTNTGGRTGTTTLTVPDGETDRQATIEVGAGRTRTVTIDGVLGTTGVRNVTLGGIESTIRIIEPSPADVAVTDVTVPETGLVNRSVPVTVTVENRGDLSGSVNLSVPVNGTDREETVTVAGRQERMVTLGAFFRSPGEYDVTVGGVSGGQISIVGSAPATVDVTDVAVPDLVTAEERVEVDVTVTNQQTESGSIDLTVPYNGTTRERTVFVGPTRMRTVTLDAVFGTPGTYTLSLGGTESVIEVLPPGANVSVTNVSTPQTALVGRTVPVSVSLENTGGRTGIINVTVPDNGTERRVRLEVGPGETRTALVNATYAEPGRYEVAADGVRSSVLVVDPARLTLAPVPDQAPPEAALAGVVRTESGEPVPGVRLQVGNATPAITPANGTASVGVPATPGEYALESRLGNRTIHNRSLRVRAEANRTFLVTLEAPSDPVGVLGSFTVSMTAYNPWAERLTREIVLRRDGTVLSEQAFDLPPAGTGSTAATLQPARRGGSQEVTAAMDGEQVATATYTVEASDRLAALLARLGLYESGSGLVQSLEELVGNFQILQVTLFGLAAAMGVGSTATVVIQAVHARRRTLGVQQATGASPRKIVRLVLGDGLRIGMLASVLGTLGAYAGLSVLVETGYTVLFGVRIAPLVNAWLIGGVLVGSVVLVGASSLLAAGWILRVEPGDLLTESARKTPDTGDGPPRPGPEVE